MTRKKGRNGAAGAPAATPRAIPASPSHRSTTNDVDEENPATATATASTSTSAATTPLLSSTWTAGEGPETVRRTSTSSRKKWERHTAGGLCVSRVSMRSGSGSGDGGVGGGGLEGGVGGVGVGEGGNEGGSSDNASVLLPPHSASSSSSRRNSISSSSSSGAAAAAALLERRQDRGGGILAAALGAVAAGLSSRPQSDDDGGESGGGGGGLRSPLLAADGSGAASDAESGRATSRLAVSSSSSASAPPLPSAAVAAGVSNVSARARSQPPQQPAALVPKKRGVSIAVPGAAAPAATTTTTTSNALRSPSPSAPLLLQDSESNEEEEEGDGGGGGDAEADSAKATAAVTLSLAFNVLLLAAKAAAFFWSGSEAVLASMVDSVIDLVSQVVLAAAERASASRHDGFPVGRARMSAVGVASAAGIMLGATLLVVQASASDLFYGFARGQIPDLVLGPLLYSILTGAIVVKAGLWVACAAAAARAPPGRADTLHALAEDHRTDVLANAAALLAGLAATRAWYADPCVAILLSLYIIFVWSKVFKRQVEKIVGKGADAETMGQLEAVASSHDAERVFVDVIRAWHAGERIFVEVEIVMDPETPLRESHDAGLALQVKLERIPLVERAFVHVDWKRRAEPEHALDRALSGLPPITEDGVAGAADDAGEVEEGEGEGGRETNGDVGIATAV